MQGLADPPSQPPTRVQQGFEGGLDALLGLLGVGPETKANQIGQLISAALPIYMGMRAPTSGLPSAPKSGLKIQQHMVEGAVPDDLPGYAPLDLYTQRPQHYETELARHLNLKVDAAEAAQRTNPYGAQVISERDAASQRGFLQQKHVQVRKRTGKRQTALRTKADRVFSDVAAAVARGEDPETILAQYRPKIETAPTKPTPKPGLQSTSRSGQTAAAKITTPQVVAIRERVWSDPDFAALPSKAQVARIQEEFGLTQIHSATIRDILSGRSFFKVGKHKQWTK